MINNILDIGFGVVLLLGPIIMICLPLKFIKMTRLKAENISALLSVLLVTPLIIGTGIGGIPMYAIIVLTSFKSLPFNLGVAIDAFWVWTLPSILITAISGWLVSYFILKNNKLNNTNLKQTI